MPLCLFVHQSVLHVYWSRCLLSICLFLSVNPSVCLISQSSTLPRTVHNYHSITFQAGQTALMLAVSRGKVRMVQLLLQAGADVNVQDEVSGVKTKEGYHLIVTNQLHLHIVFKL